jgi:hypothetical protein
MLPLYIPSPNFNLIHGNWIIKGSNTKIKIDNKEVIAFEGVSQVVLTPKVIQNNPLILHLNSLHIRKFPNHLDSNAFTALKWINKIRIHGINITINSIEDPLFVNWEILDKKGDCYLIKHLID